MVFDPSVPMELQLMNSSWMFPLQLGDPMLGWSMAMAPSSPSIINWRKHQFCCLENPVLQYNKLAISTVKIIQSWIFIMFGCLMVQSVKNPNFHMINPPASISSIFIPRLASSWSFQRLFFFSVSKFSYYKPIIKHHQQPLSTRIPSLTTIDHYWPLSINLSLTSISLSLTILH